MDPITLGRLLPIVDGIEGHRVGDKLKLSDFEQIVADNTKARDLIRRQRDILRVLRALDWVAADDHNTLLLTERHKDFVSAWNEGELRRMSESLSGYLPYHRFLHYLRERGSIQIPERQDKHARGELGRRLKAAFKAKYGTDEGINFLAFDTFSGWAVAMGQSYLSPFDYTLYWGGEWNEEFPPLDTFESICREAYDQAEKTSGYANIGQVADKVCRQLRISFQAFEIKLNDLIGVQPGLFTLAPATIREPIRRLGITIIRPRSEILRERAATSLGGGQPSARPRWLEKRFIEDGVRVNKRLLKLIRWERTQ